MTLTVFEELLDDGEEELNEVQVREAFVILGATLDDNMTSKVRLVIETRMPTYPVLGLRDSAYDTSNGLACEASSRPGTRASL